MYKLHSVVQYAVEVDNKNNIAKAKILNLLSIILLFIFLHNSLLTEHKQCFTSPARTTAASSCTWATTTPHLTTTPALWHHLLLHHVDNLIWDPQVLDGAAANVALRHAPEPVTILHGETETHTHTHTHTHSRLTALFPGLPTWAGTRKVKPIWILLKQETVSGSGISWDICKSAPHARQITTPAPHHSVFYRPDALPAAQPTASKHWRHKTETDMVAKLMLALGLLYLPTGASHLHC